MALRRICSSRLASALSLESGSSLFESRGLFVGSMAKLIALPTPSLSSSPFSSLSSFSTTAAPSPAALPPREVLEFDVVIVGGGPAGLAAALRLKQRAASASTPLSVAVLEKGAAIGAHTISGAAVDPRSLDELLGKGWESADAEARAASGVAVTADRFYYLTERGGALRLPTPPQMNNKKCKGRVLSLSELVSYLGKKAEEAGVDVFPGFAAAGLVFEEKKRATATTRTPSGDGGGSSSPATTTATTKAVAGVFTGDVGAPKDGGGASSPHRRKTGFSRGVEVRARATLLAEGARGSLTQEAERAFGLRGGWPGGTGTAPAPQTYALGLKEVWTVPPGRHSPGEAWHTVGFPLPSDTYGGGFLYHLGEQEEEREEGGGRGGGEKEGGGTGDGADGKTPSPSSSKPRRVSLGLVVGLDYKDPTLNPYQEFQKFKSHPRIRGVLEGGTCTSYGARVLNEGGWQSLPARLDFPGGALLGCAAGTLVVPRIKGVHTAVASGIMAADVAFDALREDEERAREAEERREEKRKKREEETKTEEGEEEGEEELSDEQEEEEEEDLSTPYVRPALDLSGYDRLLRESWVGRELEEARNIRPGFHLGLWPGLIAAAVDTLLFRGRAPWTLRHGLPPEGDRAATRTLEEQRRRAGTGGAGGGGERGDSPRSPSSSSSGSKQRYPPPDNVVTFPLSDSLARSGVDHDHDQPPHLKLRNARAASVVSAAIFGGPEARYCPAGVYEYFDRRLGKAAPAISDPFEIAEVGKEGAAELRINAQNCLHCKACDIKEPAHNIVWTVPEGGGGPNYSEL